MWPRIKKLLVLGLELGFLQKTSIFSVLLLNKVVAEDCDFLPGVVGKHFRLVLRLEISKNEVRI